MNKFWMNSLSTPQSKNDSVAKSKVTDVTIQVVNILADLSSEERRRVIQATLILLNESAIPPHTNQENDGDDGIAESSVATIPPKAKTWMKQNLLKLSEIAQVFHVEKETADVIAARIPGKNKKEQTINAYVIQGLSALLSTGDPSFDDKSARSLCSTHGCYDSANHSATLRAFGNKIVGSKDRGWKLTAPGIVHGASLVRELAKSTE